MGIFRRKVPSHLVPGHPDNAIKLGYCVRGRNHRLFVAFF
jgi:hypothetical protein